MKKFFTLVLFVALSGATAFAAPDFGLSMGAGGFFTAGLGGGIKAEVLGYSYTTGVNLVGGGGYAFLDATFLELGFGISGGGATLKEESNIPGAVVSNADKGSFNALDLSVLGKYPIGLGSVTLFPLFGLDYQIVVSAKASDGAKYSDAGDLSALWFQFGAGADFPLGSALFIRGEFLYGLRVKNRLERNLIDAGSGTFKYKLGHGPTLKLAIGYKFF
jgi:hypothetical protein